MHGELDLIFDLHIHRDWVIDIDGKNESFCVHCALLSRCRRHPAHVPENTGDCGETSLFPVLKLYDSLLNYNRFERKRQNH